MRTLEELRKELDVIDNQMSELFEKRMNICEEVGNYKIDHGRKVLDRQREAGKLAEVSAKVSTEFNKKGIRELYRQIMSMSRKLQYQKLVQAGALGRLPFIEMEEIDKKNVRIVFQGTEGAYGQAAMRNYFGKDCNNFHVSTFREAMEAIEEGSADYAVLPIENSTAGAVNEVYDLLVEFENYIVGETMLPITHTLCALPGTKMEEIEYVYSKAEALMQTSYFLDQYPEWQQINVANTAVAAKKVLNDADKRKAAVCSEYAAKVYGLEILEGNINNENGNMTRFIVITNQKVFSRDARKISICFEQARDECGSLYHLLSHFVYNDLNMSKIESRPIKGKVWEYRFFIDFDGNLADPAVKNAIRGLREESRNLRILGNY